MKDKYFALRFTTLLLKCFSVVAVVVGLGSAFTTVTNPDQIRYYPTFGLEGGTLALVQVLICGAVAVGLWAIADYFNAVINTADNTRMLVALMRQQNRLQAQTVEILDSVD